MKKNKLKDIKVKLNSFEDMQLHDLPLSNFIEKFIFLQKEYENKGYYDIKILSVGHLDWMDYEIVAKRQETENEFRARTKKEEVKRERIEKQIKSLIEKWKKLQS